MRSDNNEIILMKQTRIQVLRMIHRKDECNALKYSNTKTVWNILNKY